MSGQVHNPKELETLQASLEALRRQRAGVDDSAVEALMQADELSGQVNQQKTVLTQLQTEWQNGQSTLKQEETKLKHNYILLRKKREVLSAALGPDLLNRYEQTRKRRGGVAIAALQNGVCNACHVQVPTGVLSAVRDSSNDRLVICPSCGRFLYSG